MESPVFFSMFLFTCGSKRELTERTLNTLKWSQQQSNTQAELSLTFTFCNDSFIFASLSLVIKKLLRTAVSEKAGKKLCATNNKNTGQIEKWDIFYLFGEKLRSEISSEKGKDKMWKRSSRSPWWSRNKYTRNIKRFLLLENVDPTKKLTV